MSTNIRLNILKYQTDMYLIRLKTIEQHVGQLEEKMQGTPSLEQLLIVYGEITAWQEVHEHLHYRLNDYPFTGGNRFAPMSGMAEIPDKGILGAIRKIWRKRTAQREMKKLQAIQKQLEELLNTDKVLSERFCILLRKIEKEIGQRLKENDRIVELEQKEIEKLKKKFQEEMEAELLRAKRNAAW